MDFSFHGLGFGGLSLAELRLKLWQLATSSSPFLGVVDGTCQHSSSLSYLAGMSSLTHLQESDHERLGCENSTAQDLSSNCPSHRALAWQPQTAKTKPPAPASRGAEQRSRILLQALPGCASRTGAFYSAHSGSATGHKRLLLQQRLQKELVLVL